MERTTPTQGYMMTVKHQNMATERDLVGIARVYGNIAHKYGAQLDQIARG